jgi:hypothetical protein
MAIHGQETGAVRERARRLFFASSSVTPDRMAPQGNHRVSGSVKRSMGVFRDPLVLLLIATAAAVAFFLVATSM